MNESIYDTMPAVHELNHVEGFDPKSLMRVIEKEGRPPQLYLDVQSRKLWFRAKYLTGKITKKVLQFTDQFALVEARVYLDKNDPEENFISNAFSLQFANTSDAEFGMKYLELAETAATGRALADAGFGSQFADMDGEKEPTPVDSGVTVSTPSRSLKVPYQEIPSAERPAKAKNNYDAATPVETILESMTLEEAKNAIVSVGPFAGKSMGVVAVEKPSSLSWFATSYKGPDNIMRAAARKLLAAAGEL